MSGEVFSAAQSDLRFREIDRENVWLKLLAKLNVRCPDLSLILNIFDPCLYDWKDFLGELFSDNVFLGEYFMELSY